MDVLEIRNRPLALDNGLLSSDSSSIRSSNKIAEELSSRGTGFEIDLQSAVFRVELLFATVASSDPSTGSASGSSSSHAYKGWNVKDIARAAAAAADGLGVNHADANTQIDHTALASAFALRHAVFGLSIYTLLNLGLVPYYKRKLLKLYVDLPIWSLEANDIDGVVPRNLFLRFNAADGQDSLRSNLGLWYHEVGSSSGEALAMGHGHGATRLLALGAARGSILGVSAGNAAVSSDVSVERRASKVLWASIKAELETHSGDLAGGL